MIKAGTRIEGPDGMGYIFRRDTYGSDPITAGCFQAYGGAKQPEPRDPLPRWFKEWLEKNRHMMGVRPSHAEAIEAEAMRMIEAGREFERQARRWAISIAVVFAAVAMIVMVDALWGLM